jgi:predicted metalloprotease
VAYVLDDAQSYWQTELPKQGHPYHHTKLVLFTDQTPTGCGYGDAATGPFYCGADEKVYIDLGFFRVLSNQLGAKGQFARAYVIAHEIGHHVQKLLGTSARAERGRVLGESGNSVRLELQADCYAGLWSASAGQRGLLDRGDIESALEAASRIGDDVLQREETGRVRPEKFTHGTAAQRHKWLKRGYDAGTMSACDTFSAATL